MPRHSNRRSGMTAAHLIILIAGGLFIRLLATGITNGHPTDINCFAAWANMLVNKGFRLFYSADTLTDYPAGYMYVLALIGKLREVLSLSYKSYAYSVLLKTPAILADIFAGVLIYRIANSRSKEQGQTPRLSPIQLASLYVFNPLVIMISAVWGQVDGVHTVLIALSIWLLTRKKDLPAYLIFAACILIKPQSLMFAPIYIYAAYVKLKDRKFEKNAVLELVSYLCGCLAVWIFMLLPFMTSPVIKFISDPETGFHVVFTPVLSQYLNTLGSYPHCTINAYNIYALFGLNWKPLTDTFLGINYGIWGVIAIVGITAVSFFMLSRTRSRWNYFYTAAFICASVFMFSVKMHERYCFPLFLFLLISYIYSGNKKVIYLYAGLSLAAFLNCFDALRLALAEYDYSLITNTLPVFSAIWTAAYAWLAIVTVKDYRNKSEVFKDFPPTDPARSSYEFQRTEQRSRYIRKDWILMASLTVVYAAVAFFRLGDASVPQNGWSPEVGGTAVVDLGRNMDGVTMMLYNGARPSKEFWIAVSSDGVNFEYITEAGNEPRKYETDAVFRWKSYSFYANAPFRYLRITCNAQEMTILEAGFKDLEGYYIEAASLTPDAATLLDEQELVPDRPSNMNGTYFDEVYHPRTAYEFIHGLWVYETSHPPLGKLIMSIGVLLFGMTPFGWRFMGVLAGVIMVPVIFAFAKRLFKNGWAAFLTAFVFAFDFMHFVQTRLATIDSYIVLFVILMYYFMYKYYTTSFYDAKFSKTLVPLGLSGLFMGLGIASKWTGVYAGLGLAVLLAVTIYKRYTEYVRAKEQGIAGYEGFRKKTLITLAWCVVFFIVVPLIIYILSYVPHAFHCNSLYPDRETIKILQEHPWLNGLLPDNTLGNFLAGILENQRYMLLYHSDWVLSSSHPYASPWWSWPLMLRPMWYYSGDAGNGLREGISGFGNPAVWWFGLVSLVYCLQKYIRTRDRKPLFLIIGYIAQLAPWMLVSRIVFIYHYFPCVPFLAMMLGYMFNDISDKRFTLPVIRRHIRGSTLGIAFVALTLLLFILFFPVLTGIPVNGELARTVLRWLPGWVLI